MDRIMTIKILGKSEFDWTNQSQLWIFETKQLMQSFMGNSLQEIFPFQVSKNEKNIG